MEAKSLIQRGNTLQVKLGVTNYNTPFATKSSPEYVISGSAVFQVRVVAAQVNNGHTNVYNNLVFIRMEVRGLIRKGNTLQVQLDLENSHANNCPLATTMSPEYVICGATVFQVKVISSRVNSRELTNLVFIKFNKQRQNDNSTYTMTITSKELCLKNKCFTSDDSTWRLVSENTQRSKYTIDVTVQVDLVRSVNTYVPLHEDIQLTDFELRGEDGSVHFHKAVLAVSSPVLITMLGGNWRETTQGHVDIPGPSKKTLQDLKNYIYLHTLPDEDLEQLLLLSSYYMMPDLEQRCIHKLVNSLTAQNVCDLLEFAGQHKVKRLQVAILECAQNHLINVNEVRAHYLGEEIVPVAS